MPAGTVGRGCCFLGTETKLARPPNTRPRGTAAGDRGFRPRPPADTRDFVEQNQPAPPGMEGPEPSRHQESDGQGTESAILGQLYSFASDSGFVVTTTLPVTSRAP